MFEHTAILNRGGQRLLPGLTTRKPPLNTLPQACCRHGWFYTISFPRFKVKIVSDFKGKTLMPGFCCAFHPAKEGLLVVRKWNIYLYLTDEKQCGFNKKSGF
jgi:hypothetical protein